MHFFHFSLKSSPPPPHLRITEPPSKIKIFRPFPTDFFLKYLLLLKYMLHAFGDSVQVTLKSFLERLVNFTNLINQGYIKHFALKM